MKTIAIESANKGRYGTFLKNVAYSAFGGLGSKLISLICFLVLARILSPYEFGLVATVAIFTDFATIFMELGMGSAIIHNQQANQRYYSTAFWANIGMGLICCILMMASSTLIGAFFHSDDVVGIARISSVFFVLHGLSVVPVSLMQKKKHFRQVAQIEIVSIIIGFAIGIIWALHGGGVWALVASLLSIAFIKAAVCFIISRWTPDLFFGRKELIDLWRYSRYLMGTNMFGYTATNVDKIMLGKFIGSQTLGAYKFAYKIASLPMLVLGIIFNRVFFASYAELQQDKTRIKMTHLKALRLITFFTLPVMLGLNFLADHLVLAVLGEKWVEMGHVLSFLAIILIPDTLAILNQPLYLALGYTKLQFQISIFCRLNLLTGIFLGMYYGGLQGLLWGMFLAKIINFYPSFYFAGRLVGIRVWEFTQNIAGIVITGMGMFVILVIVQEGANLSEGSILSFIILLGSGIVSYLILSFLFQMETCREVFALLKPTR